MHRAADTIRLQDRRGRDTVSMRDALERIACPDNDRRSAVPGPVPLRLNWCGRRGGPLRDRTGLRRVPVAGRARSAQPAAVNPKAASTAKRGQLRERDGTTKRDMELLALTHGDAEA